MAPALDVFSLASLGAAFLAALSGSLHCVGMCGPLSLIAGNKIKSRMLYQSGRVLAYLLLGGLAGFAGSALPYWAWIPLLALGLSLAYFGDQFLPQWKHFRGRILAFASASPFFLGLGSGLLPCGLLHAWIAVAAASGHALNGALLLLLLWAGTLPALEASVAALRRPMLYLRAQFPRALPLSFLLLALLPIAWRAHIVFGPGQTTGACHEANIQENHHHVPKP